MSDVLWHPKQRGTVISIPRMGNVIRHNLYPYFSHIPGLPDLLELRFKYVEDWV